MSVNPYHKLSLRQKQAAALSSAREPSVTCPTCDTHVMPEDLVKHAAERCTGPREPGRGAKWVTWREGIAMGVPARTLANWASSGHVRFLGERQDRRYLLRDLALRISQRIGFRRR